ncbi:related to 1-acyldihydroxyacetone-phosphate reductase [Fusarium fujikuroi]|uniref:Related to 1-acyldihydroxyacetone-phosphate reductase n=2 Tax=Fusarium fujikuroi TaxID=5127 RepID=S0ELU6_GIBF5|nr:related to 1-acyldihydroxyacetone-phosphate reductase [Fusarium fujikuroi IMI 58289]KLO97521.1 1-acyldihydroxyacetone-phosphate reductase [Fusarium fujikuroi]KLP04336.1 1-acyldihydroxyacetone-phosphate reductase [Fusarium fujikuroi]KLP15627.1 1-acyldihydroxyacetone-phosphate reductase [Fusarium fujikuroi]QGI71267.1 hypothetical protein CEK27_003596 [Fusarium fujikuroi]QGI88601.1 hypothetical protein CEK25_003557 [Fusarium fujikuroi]
MTKTVLITGCSAGGLGHALAEEFHKLGYHVIATARDTKKIGPFATKPNVDIFPLDVTLPESISDLLAKIQAQGIKLDILVNNAGCASFSPLVHSDINDAKALYDVNVWGSLRVTQAFIPLLVSTQGVILNIASMAGAVPLAWQGNSKAAMTFISETLKIELEPLGVRVLTAMVGAINTEIYDGCDVVLPTDSWYKPIESIIRRQAKGELQLPNNEAVEVTAASIVRDTLSGRRGKIWRGGEAGIASVGSWLFPTWLVESILHRNRGLSALRKAHRQT